MCEVKAVEAAPHAPPRVDADIQIRSDIRKFRSKFGSERPTEPCVLVTFNMTGHLFTASTVWEAMRGDLAVDFEFYDEAVRVSDFYRKRDGGAAMTTKQNRSISGVLVVDRLGHHVFLHNPHADQPLRPGFFPGVLEIRLAPLDLLDPSNDVPFLPWNRI